MARLVSIVIPVFNEERNIPAVFQEIADVFLVCPEYTFEIIFVNDGSSDRSLEVITKLARKDSRVRGLDFSRNFGKEPATSAGCHAAQGEAILTMDADLQHPPEFIPKFLELWEQGAEVVYSVRRGNRGAGIFKRASSAMFYWLFNKISEVKTEPGTTDFRLMDKKVIEAFRSFPERGRMFRGIIDWMGYRRAKIEFVTPRRRYGRATYSYRKLFRLAMNSFTSFSLAPLRLTGYFGMFITFVSGCLLLAMLITRWFFDPQLFTPIAMLAVSNMFLTGLVLISLGFIALYIARIHGEVIDRPLYIVREKINIEDMK